MASYQTRSASIEAVSVRELCRQARSNWNAMPEWVREHYEKGGVLFLSDGIIVETPQGQRRGGLGHMLVQDESGNITMCDPTVFAAMYESA